MKTSQEYEQAAFEAQVLKQRAPYFLTGTEVDYDNKIYTDSALQQRWEDWQAACLYQRENRDVDFLDNLENTALDAVSYVGAANYAERESEALSWVREAFDKARGKEDE